MSTADSAASQPSPAERVRAVLVAAGSVGVIANGVHEDLVGADLLRFHGGLALRAPVGCRLAEEACAMAAASTAGVPALLEWTDISPVAVRDRVRARVRITGRLHGAEPDTDGTVRMGLTARQILFQADGLNTLVHAGELAAATVDPVARHEATLLLHLSQDHQDHVEALTRLVEARDLMGVSRVTPHAIDRRGIVLRLDYHPGTRGHRDVRLPFAEPLDRVDDLGQRIHALIAHAPARPRRTAF
jgi:hypothetical protein